MPPGLYVAVSGNIGTGKSALTGVLADALGAGPAYERPELNPWFEQLSADPARWSLAAELSFVAQSGLDLVSRQARLVQERFPREHVEIFGQARRDNENLTADEFSLIQTQLRIIEALGGLPDLIVWLRATPAELLKRVRQRAHAHESTITLGSLEDLGRAYERFFAVWAHCPVISVDTEAVDLRVAANVANLASEIENAQRSGPS